MATITRRGNGWFAQVRRKGYPARYKSFAAKVQAQRWAREQELAFDNQPAKNLSASGCRFTLGELMGRYGDRVTPKKRSAASELLRLGKMMAAPVCSVLLDELKPSHFAEYRDHRLSTVKPATVRRELSLFRVALEVARREWGVSITRNPLDDVGRPVAHNARERRLERGEAKLLAETLKTNRRPLLGSIIWFLVETGMRRGEALALEWRFVDLESRTALLPTTKNGRPRIVPLTDRAVEILQAISRVEARVFPMSVAAVQNGWRRLTVRAGISDLRLHDLRHEALSRFSELGLNTPELASISGHRDVRMLMRYMHPRPLELARKLAGRSWENEVGFDWGSAG